MWEPVRVAVVESDAAVRAALMAPLREEGFLVVGVGDVGLLRPLLRVSPHRLVVLLGPQPDGPDHQKGRALARKISQLPPHAYVLLSTLPRQARTAVYNPHTRRTVPVLPADVGTVVRGVIDAARHLAIAAAPVAVAG